jgi:hypothetical protein
MSKLLLTLTAGGIVSLAACKSSTPEPPPRYRPYPTPGQDITNPYGQDAYNFANPPTGTTSPTPAPSPSPAPAPMIGGYPSAQATANPNQVLSPYEPYNVIDVEGFKSGQLARDPSNQKIFRIP